MNYDGWVTVGTKLDTKQLEKDLKSSERKLQQYEKEAEQLTKTKAKAEVDLQSYYEEKRLIQQITDEANQYAQTTEEVSRNLETEKLQLAELNQKYSTQLKNLDDVNRKIQENTLNQGLFKNKITETNEKLGQSKKIASIKDILKDIGKETSKNIKNATKWALAIFGVRAVYGFIRNAMGTLSQYNQQIATDIEYIGFAMATALQPLIESMISLAFQLLSYVNYIAQAWFGVNLFANASADAMKRASQSAEKMKKSMGGFDEMNVLNSNGSVGAIGTNPSMELTAPENIQPPAWLVFITENKDLILSALIGIVGAVEMLKLGLGFIVALGVGVLLAGVYLSIKGIVDFIKDPSWKNFLTILQGIALVVAGIAMLFGGWIVALVAFGVAVVANVIQNWDKVKEILGVVGKWFYDNIILPIWNFIKAIWDAILTFIRNQISVLKGIFFAVINIIANPFIVAKDTIIDVFNGIKTFFQGFGQVIKSLFSGDIAGALQGFKQMFKGIMDSLWGIAKAPINLIIGGVNSLIRGLNKISFEVPDWVPGVGGNTWGIQIKEIPKLAVGGIVNLPSRGVPVGGARTGEAGAEGVIPLTDSQAMETLGEAIGRYITINANITNTMNGRVISRELQRINNNSDFAFNK